MNVEVELPEDIARRLATQWDDLPLRALEAIAVEGYRTEAFLKERQAYLHYDESDLEQDRAILTYQ